jgi:hypothetical protein
MCWVICSEAIAPTAAFWLEASLFWPVLEGIAIAA